MITIKKTTHEKLLKLNSICREIFAWIGIITIYILLINPEVAIKFLQQICKFQ